MEIHFTGHHIEVTDGLREYTQEKFKKIQRHFDRITSIHVTFTIDHFEQIAKASVHVPGHQFESTGKTKDMYESIDEMVHVLDRQIIKHKEKISGHRE